jgi:hypothetical protein
MTRLLATAALTLGLLAIGTAALDNGRGRTPVMAYSTWNMFNKDISDKLIRELVSWSFLFV